MFYATLNNFTPIKFSDYFQLNDFSTCSHSLTIFPLFSLNDTFRYSFFVNTVFSGIQSHLMCSQFL